MPIPNAPIINATKAAGGRRDDVRSVPAARVAGSASWVLTIPPICNMPRLQLAARFSNVVACAGYFKTG